MIKVNLAHCLKGFKRWESQSLLLPIKHSSKEMREKCTFSRFYFVWRPLPPLVICRLSSFTIKTISENKSSDLELPSSLVPPAYTLLFKSHLIRCSKVKKLQLVLFTLIFCVSCYINTAAFKGSSSSVPCSPHLPSLPILLPYSVRAGLLERNFLLIR